MPTVLNQSVLVKVKEQKGNVIESSKFHVCPLIKLIGSSLNYKSEATNPDEEDQITLTYEHSVMADLTSFLLPKSPHPPLKKEIYKHIHFPDYKSAIVN